MSECRNVGWFACERVGGDTAVAEGTVSASDERSAGSAQTTVRLDSETAAKRSNNSPPRQRGSREALKQQSA